MYYIFDKLYCLQKSKEVWIMGYITLNLLISMWLYGIGMFTFKSAVTFFIIEFIFFIMFLWGRDQIHEDIDLDEMSDEEAREKLKKYIEKRGDK